MKLNLAKSWRQYLESWTSCMGDTYWFKQQHFFDYNREEETATLRGDFAKGENIFLVASD